MNEPIHLLTDDGRGTLCGSGIIGVIVELRDKSVLWKACPCERCLEILQENNRDEPRSIQ